MRNKRYWIMGASSGIGAALAAEMNKRGAHLVLSARSDEKLQEVASTLDDCKVITADVSDPDSLKLAASAITNLGALDGAINLAAIYDPGRVMEADAAKAAQIVTVNLTGTLNFAQASKPLLKPGGILALTGSIAGHFGLPNGQIYSATKAGVTNLAESLRAELSPGVDVRLLSPGFVRTRLTEENDFEMPFILEPEEAAKRIADGLESGSFEIHFPKRLTLALKALRVLPYVISMPLIKRFVK